MSSSQKKITTETGRWVRVSVLSASTILPVINAIRERMQAQQQAEVAPVSARSQEYKEKVAAFATDVQADWQERVQSVGTTLSDVLTELRARSNNQDLISRTSELRDDLKDRSSKLSQAFAERGSAVTNQWAKKGRKAQQSIAEQDRRFWIALGFGFGLTAAGIVTFVLIRRRLQHPAETEEQAIELPLDAAYTEPVASQPRGEIYSLRSSQEREEAYEDAQSVPEEIDAFEPSASSVPADTSFVGVAYTKQYYPVSTPLDQLADASEQPIDVIYFASEQEAQAQGFTPARV
ncbi:hypothetical protein [Dictyobacter arantiisoli]|uniref:Uncharacterized protein n=1 Tax=Dictyobacter arantiisoli TaxID=2014874 RepID=A0A5A5T7L5_9CHLR|nr:hypothetical protein [Dictyobacter arantiisoli]GCF07245.1 hypothetical protein KDI_08090 [Dictyobacter arantiisoli]